MKAILTLALFVLLTIACNGQPIPNSIWVHGILFHYDNAMSDDVLRSFNYIVSDSELNVIDIIEIARVDTNTVVIFIPILEYSTTYTITVAGVRDIYNTLINPSHNSATVYFDSYSINKPQPYLIIR